MPEAVYKSKTAAHALTTLIGSELEHRKLDFVGNPQTTRASRSWFTFIKIINEASRVFPVTHSTPSANYNV